MEQVEQADYFRRRAEEERDAATKARDERAARLHRAMAARYDAKASGSPVHGLGDGPSDHLHGPARGFTILP